MGEPIEQGAEPFGPRAVIDIAALRALDDEPGLFERLQMLRDRALRHPAGAGQRGHIDLIRAREALEHRAPGGISQRAQYGIDGNSLHHAH